MKLNSKELTLIFIEFLIAVSLWILSSRLDPPINTKIIPSIIGSIFLIIIISIIVALIFGIIYKRIGEIDKALESQEINQLDLEEKLKRYEQLIDVRASIKDLQRRMEKIENGKKTRF